MKTTQIGIDLIKHFESLHDGDLTQIGLQPKMCPAGIWTEGYGHAMRDLRGQFFKGIANKENAYANSIVKNEVQATHLLEKDLEVFENIVMRKIKVPLKENQFDALVSYTYNTGGSDTLFKLINQNAPDDQIKKWFETKYITANGKVLNGLVARRKAESKLYFL
jgi:lysozyme